MLEILDWVIDLELINGNKFINLDIREEVRSEQKIMKVLDTKLKVFFNKHKI